MIIPKNVEIETINGYCTARCIMCSIDSWRRTPNIMSNDNFIKIINKLEKYKNQIQFLTLFGYGEPLLDKGLVDKVKIAKEKGFNGIGFATNCTELSEQISKQLLEVGLDTLICSIDGMDKQTHESIRIGTNFEKILDNVQKFIYLRNQNGHTKVIIRFIRQKLNEGQWPAFEKYWLQVLNPKYGDQVIKYDVHNWGGNLYKYQNLRINAKNSNNNMDLGDYFCKEIFDKLFIYSSGDVALCCVDSINSVVLGNALVDDPILIFNNDTFSYYRKMFQDKHFNELEHCKNCTIAKKNLE